MASGLSRRVSEIEAALVLVGYLHDRLRFLSPTMGGLVASACGAEGLDGIPYLTECRRLMVRGRAFPAAWKAAVAGHHGSLAKEEEALLASLGDVLGATDLESQLSSLEYTRQQLELRLADARRYREKHQKLYGTLGILGGLAIAIVLI